jgi:type I restriction enzyme S subunit
VGRIDEFIFDDEIVLVTEDETFYGREKPIAYRSSGKCWVNNHAHVLRASTKVGNDYLCFSLMHYDVIPWLTGTTGRAKLTQQALNSLPILIPPHEEMAEIVRRVETLFAFADRLESRLKAAQTAADRLTPALLAKAFRGELVPQDPNDEPAAELLQRLAASRDAAPKTKRGRRSATA